MRKGKKSTLVYILKNFMFMLPLVILPAALLGFSNAFSVDNTPADFFINYAKQITSLSAFTMDNFTYDLFNYFTSVNLSANWWVYLLGAVTLFFSLCMTVSAVERHMRLGMRSYSSIFSMLNESLLSVLPYFLIMTLGYEFISIVICGMIYLFYVMNIGGWLLFFLSLAVTVIFYAVYMVFMMLSICTVPSMLSDGYRFNVAVSYSARLVSTKLKSIMLKFYGTFLVAWLIKVISRYLFTTMAWYPMTVHIIISILYYVFWCMFLPVFAMKIYNDLTEGVRNDIRVSLF